MPSDLDELDATTDIVTLAEHADGLGKSTARRLDDNGVETVADLLIAERETLTDIPYVAGERADQLLALADEVAEDEDEDEDEPEPEPLVDPREQMLDIGLGEKVQVTFVDEESWAEPRYVVAVEEPVEWEAGNGDTWTTRRVTIANIPTGESRREDDLVLVGDTITLEREYGGERYSNGYSKGVAVESVAVVGRCSDPTYYQLLGQQEQVGAETPEGDDTWQKYQKGGETA